MTSVKQIAAIFDEDINVNPSIIQYVTIIS
ncbi:hypothetical protein SDC9_172266 [bioreactor metagenome]|uniref:Uncharacterized protein n=1 Tax=bioreactor metagenome TaxID=1076179 RepID=A0A645GD74_9ZZZZ